MRKLYFSAFIAVPILIIVFLINSAFVQGNLGFRTDRTQKGLLITGISNPINKVQLNDLIISVNGLSHLELFGYAIHRTDFEKNWSIKIIRDGSIQSLQLKKIPFKINTIFPLIWPSLLLIATFLGLAVIALNNAPPSSQANLLILMLCGLSTSLAATMASAMGLILPQAFSFNFIIHTISNWIAFGLWAHFSLRFPDSRDLLKNNPRLSMLIYLIPALTSIGCAAVFSGFSMEFWGWVQRLRNIYLPLIILGVFIKHAYDYNMVNSQYEKNQIKLPLFAYWLSFAPYFLLNLLPNLMFDFPLISFRIVQFAFFILPIAYLVSLLRYRLLNVDQIISRSLAYFTLIAGLLIIYSILLVLLKEWLFGKQVLSVELFLIFLIFVNIIFHPLILKIDLLIRKLFLRRQYISPKTLHQFSNKISTSLQLPDLIELITDKLPEKIYIRSTALMTLEKKRSRLFPSHLRFGETPWPKSSLVKHFNENNTQYFSTYQDVEDERLQIELTTIQNAGFSLVLPLRTASSLSALLFIGPKKSGSMYHDEDIHLLATFTNQAAIALENAIQHESLLESKKRLEELFDQKVQSEKMAAIGEMTSIIAHELKNPLGIIHSSAQYLIDGKRSKTVIDEMLEYIKSEAEHLNLSISSILKLARQKPPEFKGFKPGELIGVLITHWKRSNHHNPDIKIRLELHGDLPEIQADPNQINQVILNLIRNSEDMMTNGNIIIRAKYCDSDQIQIQVLDEGPGIPPENTKKIFKSFFTTKKKGLGLGLSASRQIIKAHNGEITIENRKEQGAVATIQLPVSPILNIEQPYIKETLITGS